MIIRPRHSGKTGRQEERRGAAMALALFSVAFVAAAGAAFLQMTSSTSRRQGAELSTTKAFYLAEAGLAEAFHAIRIGRNGQVGSETRPSVYGDGLVWVDASRLPDGQIQLTSTGMSGRGRAALSFILEPTEIMLGMFSVEDIVVDQVILVDGYDSDKGSYWDQVPKDFALPETTDSAIVDLLSETWDDGSAAGCHLGYHNWCNDGASHSTLYGDPESADFSAAYASRSLGRASDVALVHEKLMDAYESAVAQSMGAAGEQASLNGDSGLLDSDLPMRPPIGEHTNGGAMLGSNGSITFALEEDQFAEVYGDLKPGPEGVANTNTMAVHSGSNSGRGADVVLPEVQIPEVELASAILHEDLLPYTIPSGTNGFESFTVASDAELIIQGPATLVIGQLTLEEGATLTLDTRSGDISLFVTEGMDLKEGSATITTEEQPKSLTVQIAAIESDGLQAPVNLESSAQFFGTIYSPQTEVFIGSDFEVFGGVIAKKMSFGPGARLHVDHSGTTGSSLPTIVAWKITEIPAMVKGQGRDPFTILGVTKSDLTPMNESHDLANVDIEITYTDVAGAQTTYSGPESEMNWDDVASVANVERVPTIGGQTAAAGEISFGSASGAAPPQGRMNATEDTSSVADSNVGPMGETAADEEATQPTGEETVVPTGIRPEMGFLIGMMGYFGIPDDGTLAKDAIMPHTPLSAEEWAAIASYLPEMGVNGQQLMDADIAAGGTGGQ